MIQYTFILYICVANAKFPLTNVYVILLMEIIYLKDKDIISYIYN